jgi:aspartate/methionine/tyrosine aminotransferase
MTRPEGSLISYFSNRVKKEGGLNLAQGTPGFPPPIELLKILEENALNPGLHQYPPGIGNFKLLDQIKQRFSPYYPIDTHHLLMVQGATEGIFLSLLYLSKQLNPPFSALSFDPVYESYPILSKILDIPFIYQDLEDDLQIDFQRLEQTIHQQNVGVVFVASPGNPLGKVWSHDELEQLINLSKQYGFYIIFDAVYKDIYFGEEPFNPLTFGYDKLFYVDSFSKTLSITGWRIGYVIAAPEHMKQIRAMHDYTGLCAPSILQTTIADYLETSQYGENYIAILKQKCRKSFEYMKNILHPLGFHVSPISGGYFIWARLPQKFNDAFSFAVKLFEDVGVGVVPGENFSHNKHNYIRINIAHEINVIVDAAERLKQFFNPEKP